MAIRCDNSVTIFDPNTDILFLEKGTILKAKREGFPFLGRLWRCILTLRGDVYKLPEIERRLHLPVNQQAEDAIHKALQNRLKTLPQPQSAKAQKRITVIDKIFSLHIFALPSVTPGNDQPQPVETAKEPTQPEANPILSTKDLLDRNHWQFATLSTIAEQISRLRKQTNHKSFRPALLALLPQPLRQELSSQPSAELQLRLNTIDELESSLQSRYAREWSQSGWHRGQSFQRIIFQDTDFAKQFADPTFIKALLYRLCNDDYSKAELLASPAFAGSLTLAEMVIEGLSKNSLDFLLSASPYWFNMPSIPGFTWHTTNFTWGLRVPGPETPTRAEAKVANIQSVLTGLKILQQQLSTINPGEDVKLVESIDRADVTHLKTVLRNAVLKAKLADDTAKKGVPGDNKCLVRLICGKADTVAYANSMVVQSFDILANYEDLTNPKMGHLDIGSMLNYGVISHALDSPSFLADIAHLENLLPIVPQNPKDVPRLNKGAEALRHLLAVCEDGSAGPEATFLLTSRLRQAVRIVLQRLQEKISIGYTMDEFKTDLGSSS